MSVRLLFNSSIDCPESYHTKILRARLTHKTSTQRMSSRVKLKPVVPSRSLIQPARQPVQLKIPGSAEPIQVFCRLRAVDENSCVKVRSATTVQVTRPESAINVQQSEPHHYSFRKIFDETNSRTEIFNTVALPLVVNLISNRSGLLFTYGTSGSGKTYTMTGVPEEEGIIPRCFDVLFNSIWDRQARRFVFQPDRLNGFDIQSVEDAEKNTQLWRHELIKKAPQRNSIDALSNDGTKVQLPNDSNAYAVFVTYVEVYNNNIYDLLETANENGICAKLWYNKVVKEDAARNCVCILGVTEVEVKSAEEAREVFYRGQKRKRTAPSALNSESNRSHSIFTIRLVQAPLDADGQSVSPDKEKVCISQLSLVDLAGSERTKRAGNVGQRQRETDSINSSLTVLRYCLETLRDNQLTGYKRPIPFRESKLTHLLKNLFAGQGDTRVIVCANPRVDNHDEMVQTMQFAEVSQEILVRPIFAKMEHPDDGVVPGPKLVTQMQRQSENSDKDNVIPYNAEMIFSLIAAQRHREEQFFKMTKEFEAIHAARTDELKKVRALEDKIIFMENEMSSLKAKYDQIAEEYEKLKRDFDNKDVRIDPNSMKENREQQTNGNMLIETLGEVEQHAVEETTIETVCEVLLKSSTNLHDKADEYATEPMETIIGNDNVPEQVGGWFLHVLDGGNDFELRSTAHDDDDERFDRRLSDVGDSQKLISCSMCDKSFNGKTALRIHMISHSEEKPFSCSICAKSFGRMCTLNRHMITHEGSKPFSCPICQKTFGYKCALKQHSLLHSGVKPFRCTMCGKAFTYKCDLKEHTRCHIGEKLFACSICGKAFMHPSNLRDHEKIHTGVKTYVCAICNKAFLQKGTLAKHMPLHTGVKPFSCLICGKSFALNAYLRRHVRTHAVS